MDLKELEVYRIARKISKEAWNIYERFDWQIKKIMGDQWITSIDSIGANIAEGFGRFHYLDKNKFNYNSRGSLFEAFNHWTELLFERNKITQAEFTSLATKFKKLQVKLNNYISTTKKQTTKNN